MDDFTRPNDPSSFPSWGNEPQVPQGPWQRFRTWVASKPLNATIVVVAGSILALCLLCGFIGTVGAAIHTTSGSQTTAHSAIATHTSSTKVPTLRVSPVASPTLVPTATSVATATVKPPPTLPPAPIPTATKPPASTNLFLHITCGAATDHSYGQVCVQTQPGAALTIDVYYHCTGRDADSNSLKGTVYADGSGAYEWDWVPDSKCTGGVTATVSANWHGQSISASDTFND